MSTLQMWGGLECTLNRVGDRYINQCDKNGHNQRLSDLALFKSLGIKKLRYPCLWEMVAPKDLDHCDWSFLDERLNELKRLDQDIIATLLHHGSGPYYTSLIDPDFPEKFATYARLFAQRYPWITDYTPINEINTTARFSVLYGHWYPHLKDEAMYLRSLVLQTKATILAMREIRRVNPHAKLIQTDDLGKCQSTPELADQRDMENERRWLTWDLLSGKVNKEHALYSLFMKNHINPADLEWLEENACRPDIIGVNHYLLSNRYLDHRMELFPKWSHGGNGIQAYADVGAVDTGFAENISPEEILKEAWDRYKIPVAVTECHTMGNRESQMRWLDQVWKSCQALRENGAEIVAVTAWSLLGTFDWNKLCTICDMFYEPGVFDLRNPQKMPKETALSEMVRNLAMTGEYKSPLLGSEGIWKTGRRIVFNALPGQHSSLEHNEEVQPVLIIGASGTLGQAFARVCGSRNIRYQLLNRHDMDISRPDSIARAIEYYKPWAIINAAGYVRVDEAEDDMSSCYRTNVEGAVNLARAAKLRGLKLVNFSSDLVFDGNAENAYTESHEISPLNIYGKSKADCETKVLSIYPESLMIRTSAFFGPWDEHNFVTKTLRSLVQNSEVVAPKDMFVSPTYVPDLANETLNLMIDGEKGIFHITNVGEVSWEEFAIKAAMYAEDYFDVDTRLIRGVPTSELSLKAKRPMRSVLRSEKQLYLPTLENAFERYFSDLQVPIFEQQENRI